MDFTSWSPSHITSDIRYCNLHWKCRGNVLPYGADRKAGYYAKAELVEQAPIVRFRYGKGE